MSFKTVYEDCDILVVGGGMGGTSPLGYLLHRYLRHRSQGAARRHALRQLDVLTVEFEQHGDAGHQVAQRFLQGQAEHNGTHAKRCNQSAQVTSPDNR